MDARNQATEALAFISTQVNPDVFSQINELYQVLCVNNISFNHLDEYLFWHANVNVRLKEIDGIIQEIGLRLIEQDSEHTDTPIHLQQSLKELQVLIKSSWFLKSRSFFQQMLADKITFESQCFEKTIRTPAELRKKRNRLLQVFHPDRHIGENSHAVYAELTASINNRYETLIRNNVVPWRSLKKRAANELYLAVDVNHAAKKNWDKLTHYQKIDLQFHTENELNRIKKAYALSAYNLYRSAAQAMSFDEGNYWEEQVRLRINMAKALYLSVEDHRYLHAELCAISAIYMIDERCEFDRTRNLRREARQWLDKIRQKNTKSQQQNEDEASEEKSESHSNSSLVRSDQSDILTVWENTQLSTRRDRKQFSQRIKRQVSDVLREEVSILERFSAEGGTQMIVRTNSPDEIIYKTRERAKFRKVVGAAGQVGGVVVGGGLIGVNLVEIFSAAGAGVALGPVAGVLLGLAGLGAGVYFGVQMFRQGQNMFREPERRENLNAIIEEAMIAYQNGDRSAFFEALSKSFSAKEDREQKKLVTYSEGTNLDISPRDILNNLLDHGIRPDGAAYIMYIIAECLFTSNLRLERQSQNNLDMLALSILDMVIQNERLLEKARELDARIRAAHFKGKNDNFRGALSKYFTKEFYEIPEHYFNDAEEAPFVSRLEEVRQLARINKILIHIISVDEDDFRVAKNEIAGMQAYIDNNFQFFSVSQIQFEIIKDIVFIFDTQPEESNIFDNSSNPSEDILSIADQQIAEADFFLQAERRVEEAEEYDFEGNYLLALEKWAEAEDLYARTQDGNQQNLINEAARRVAQLGVLYCQVKRHRYPEVREALNNIQSTMQEDAFFWNILTLADIGLHNYRSANYANNQALIFSKGGCHDKDRILAKKLKQFLTRIKLDPVEQRLNHYERPMEDYNVERIDDQHDQYNIISIDGGGLRGIIPLVWVAELERLTNRPLMHMFHMAAGTSTGGIVAGALSVPSAVNPRIPKYTAGDVLNLYKNQGRDIFTREQGWGNWLGFRNLQSPKYGHDGLKRVLSEYCGDTTLSECVGDIVIPAVGGTSAQSLVTFTNSGRRFGEITMGDLKLRHALLATSAAPTYFPAYSFNDEYYLGRTDLEGNPIYESPFSYPFVDGGVNTNNPAQLALQKAMEKGKPKERIFIWSLGTGDYVPIPSDPDAERNLLFYATNLPQALRIMLDGPNNNLIQFLHQDLGDQFIRWQTYLNAPIPLDSIDPESHDIMISEAVNYLEHAEEIEAPWRLGNVVRKLMDPDGIGVSSSSFFQSSSHDRQFNPSSGRDEVKQEENIYSGVMPNGGEISFHCQKVAADGNCGFHVLGVTRDAFCEAMLSLKHDENVRAALMPEIYEAFIAQSLQHDEWQALQDTKVDRHMRLDQQFRELLEQHPDFMRPLDADQERCIQLLLDYLVNHEFSDKAEELRRSMDGLNHLEDSIKAFLETEEIYEAYFSVLKNNQALWVGYDSIMEFAAHENISVYIWSQHEDGSSAIGLRQHYETQSPSRIVHMLHRPGFTHFDRLENVIGDDFYAVPALG